MSLSISTMKPQELSALAGFNLCSEIVAVQMNAEGGPKIITLPKGDVTCWQLFLRFFGAGKLAKTQVHLRDVASHLNQFNWAAGAAYNGMAYLTTCRLANKALSSKWDETLLNNVAMDTVEKKMEFAQYQSGRLLNRHDVAQSFKWNPSMQVKHVKVLIAKHFQGSKIRIEDKHYHPISPNTNASRELLKQARIYIEQRLPEPIVLPVPVPAPVHHHHHHCTHGQPTTQSSR